MSQKRGHSGCSKQQSWKNSCGRASQEDSATVARSCPDERQTLHTLVSPLLCWSYTVNVEITVYGDKPEPCRLWTVFEKIRLNQTQGEMKTCSLEIHNQVARKTDSFHSVKSQWRLYPEKRNNKTSKKPTKWDMEICTCGLLWLAAFP